MKPNRRGYSSGGCTHHRKYLGNTTFRPSDHGFRGADTVRYRLQTWATSPSASASTPAERILRYPDGAVRTIRYPETFKKRRSEEMLQSSTSPGEGISFQPPSPPSPAGDWYICSETDESCTFGPTFGEDSELPGAAPVEELWGARRKPSSIQSPAKEQRKPVEEFGVLPSSPAALLEYFSSEKFADEQRQLKEKVTKSYEVLWGCPWPVPRPLLTVAVRKEHQEHASAYTLSVAVEQEGGANELAKLLEKPHLNDALSIRSLQDGIITFDDEACASIFIDNMHAAGKLSATMTEVDSHQLFKMAADAKAAVVLVCGTESGNDHYAPKFVPTPAQLASDLRSKGSLDSW